MTESASAFPAGLEHRLAMKLYFAPLACSLVARIVALETKARLTYRQVELFRRTLTEDGSPYLDVAPLELVPVLELDDGERLTEVGAIVQYLADQKPEAGLLPGGRERYRVLSWLGYSASELHKRILWVLANPRMPSEPKAFVRTLAPSTFDHLERHLAGREYVAADRFTVADAHLGWALGVASYLKLDLGDRPALRAYVARMSARPSIAEAFAEEMPLFRPAMERQSDLRQRPA